MFRVAFLGILGRPRRRGWVRLEILASVRAESAENFTHRRKAAWRINESDSQNTPAEYANIEISEDGPVAKWPDGFLWKVVS